MPEFTIRQANNAMASSKTLAPGRFAKSGGHGNSRRAGLRAAPHGHGPSSAPRRRSITSGPKKRFTVI